MRLFWRDKKSRIEEDSVMSFFAHLDVLRRRFVRIIGVIIALAVVCFIFNHYIIDHILLGPKSASFPINQLFKHLAEVTNSKNLIINDNNVNLINTQMAGQVNLSLYTSFLSAIILSIPYILWELWQFIKPALSNTEIKRSNTFLFYTNLCFLAGICFGYFIISPLTVNFLTSYTASNQIDNLIDINSYFSTIMLVSLSTGLVFLLPIIAFFLTKMGIISAGLMRHYRRHAILMLTIIAAIITPPDIVSCVLVLLPMLALYEISIWISAREGAKRVRSENLK